MRRFFAILLTLLLLSPACALAELKRGDSGGDVLALQQMLWETGFIFEEPDGAFGRNTEEAVKWFQEYAGLEQTGRVDEDTMDALYACWVGLMQEQGLIEPAPEDAAEPQGVEGDYPVCCQRSLTTEGNEHIEPCGRHAALSADETLPAIEKWTNELNALYDEWLDASPEENRAAIASSQAFFTLWVEQQAAALEKQGAEDGDARIERLLRGQCAELCGAIYALRAE